LTSPVADLCLKRCDTVRLAMQRINRGVCGIILVVDDAGRLEATVTDGDIRRGLLAGLGLDSPLSAVSASKADRYRTPISAPAGTDSEDQIRIMRRAGVRHLPLLDEGGRVVELGVLDDLVAAEDRRPAPELAVQAVIMAGGFGARLRPLTDNTPKPMLPVGGRPLMQRTIERLQQAGVSRIHITTHYQPETIRRYFKNGADFGVELEYLAEDEPLGTAGALSLVEDDGRPLLVINGDILTQVDFRQLVAFHVEQRAALTVGVRQYDLQVPYGVIEACKGRVSALREKPRLDFLVNAGIYVVEPAIKRLVPAGERCDMTELIGRLLDLGKPVASFPIVEYWLDIGRHEDFERAQHDAATMRWAS
jgi:dTDP-glucose pyrophosphorylase